MAEELADEPGPLKGVERAMKDSVGQLQGFVDQLTFDPYWFRRAFHALGACFVVYYILPQQGATMAFVHQALPLVLFAGALAVETFRILGNLPTEAFFGLREYERFRLSGYVYFASAVVLLLYAFPPAVAAACIVGAAIGDPILGEFRRVQRAKLGWVACFAFGLVVFLVLGFHPLLGVAGAALLVAGEVVKNPVLDDDFTMPMLPAVGLVALEVAGVFALLHTGFPDPFVYTVEVPAWLP